MVRNLKSFSMLLILIIMVFGIYANLYLFKLFSWKVCLTNFVFIICIYVKNMKLHNMSAKIIVKIIKSISILVDYICRFEFTMAWILRWLVTGQNSQAKHC